MVNGIVMGGGVGVFVYGSYWIGMEKIFFFMLEIGIGFFFDVGGIYFLLCMLFKFGVYCVLSVGCFK